jgi:hypothetical protein
VRQARCLRASFSSTSALSRRPILRTHQSERFPHQRAKRLVVYRVEFDTDPSRRPDIRGPKVHCRRLFDQRFLYSWSCRHPHRNMSVVVVIVGEHREHPLRREEGRLTVRELLDCAWDRQAHAPQPGNLPPIVLPWGVVRCARPNAAAVPYFLRHDFPLQIATAVARQSIRVHPRIRVFPVHPWVVPV